MNLFNFFSKKKDQKKNSDYTPDGSSSDSVNWDRKENHDDVSNEVADGDGFFGGGFFGDGDGGDGGDGGGD